MQQLITLYAVGEFDRSDASVQVLGLKPGTYYGIRAIATNSGNLSSQSRLIQVQTVPLSGHDGSRVLAAAEQSGTQTHGRRQGSGQRHSLATSSSELTGRQPQSHSGNGEDKAPEESMSQMTKRLDFLRCQQEEVDRQIADDLSENERTRTALSKEREELKQKVEEREKAHIDFRKQVNELEKQCKATQRKKSAKERLLQQKKCERQKKVDDIARWRQESAEMHENAEAMEREKIKLEEEHEKKMAATRKLIDEANGDNKILEEEIRIWGVKIKELEEERRKNDSEQDDEEKEAERREREEEEAHEKRVRDLQAQIAEVFRAKQQVSMPEPSIDPEAFVEVCNNCPGRN